MKLTDIGKMIGIGAIALVMTGCGSSGGGSSGGGSIPSSSDVYVDSELGLMWQDDIYVEVVRKPWIESTGTGVCYWDPNADVCHDDSGDTAATYCSDMRLEGYADWRLPTGDEMLYLSKSDKFKNFQHLLDGSYWTSTTAGSMIGHFPVAVSYYYDSSDNTLTGDNSNRTWDHYVRCIRNIE